jgi:hypothetical protein
MIQKNLRVTCVLGGDGIDLFKYTQRSQGNVFEIADGSGNDIEGAGHKKDTDGISFVNAPSDYSRDPMTG